MRSGTVQPSPRILVIAGWSGSGKTTLIRALLPALASRGLSVSTIKHAHEGFDLDRPGKDSAYHRAAGAREVMVLSPERWALLHELRGGRPLDVQEAVAKMEPVDLVLVEGFKGSGLPLVEVRRAVLGRPDLRVARGERVAVVTDDAAPDVACPVISPRQPDQLAAFIVDWMERSTVA